MHLWRVLVVAVVAAALAACAASKTASAAAPNCAVTAPPTDAGIVEFLHGNVFLVFPRRPAVTPSYTGCVSYWLNERLIVRYYVQSGEVHALHVPPEQERPGAECKVVSGKLGPAQPVRCEEFAAENVRELARPRPSITLACYERSRERSLKVESCPKE